ncbi:MAG: MSMEG_4193 family putative phosphomutase [Acidimicrobiia bacterium]|nr:MSMEG_4193 family putative phosphomutase [Acidimicrobiia bacterium]
MACSVFLVRHGVTAETGAVLSGRKPGIALSEAGIAQAEATAALLSNVKFAACYASPIQRTTETAQIVAAPHGLAVVPDDAFIEAEYGEWTDVPLADLRKHPLWPVIQHTPSRAVFPGGEAMRAIQHRAVDGIERLGAAHDGEAILIVSHADVIKAILAHYLGTHLDLFQRIHVSPASISIVQLSSHGPMVACVNQRPGDAELAAYVPQAAGDHHASTDEARNADERAAVAASDEDAVGER